MKKLFYLLSIVVLSSCASNKYAAHFNQYDRHESYANGNQFTSLPVIDPATVTASLETKPVILEPSILSEQVVKKTLANMTKQQAKQVKSQIKKEIKKMVSQKASMKAKVVNASAGVDHDLKLAAIFGAVGLVALIIAGNAFNIIGGIALIIGVVFFVKWLIRQ